MDEYERAAFELKSLLQNVGAENFERIADAETTDEDCRSIQTVTSHVIGAGHSYANYFRESFSTSSLPVERKSFAYSEIIAEIDKMLAYTAETFDGKWEMTDEQITTSVINTRWGVTYDVEQLFEHAIVHILRHRRQIEKFLLKFENRN